MSEGGIRAHHDDDGVDLLILGGSGWTSSQFLIPHLKSHHPEITFAATSRDGRDGTIKWTFNPPSSSSTTGEGGEGGGNDDYHVLPLAKTVVITFPIKGKGASRHLVTSYERAKALTSFRRDRDGNEEPETVKWIQLGSTGIWDGGPTLVAQDLQNRLRLSHEMQPTEDVEKLHSQELSPPDYSDSSSVSFKWTDRHSPYDRTNLRAIAEDELLSLHRNTFVLNLSGLWGGERDPSNWISKIAHSKQALELKGSLHLIHGLDVSRAIIAVHLASSSSNDNNNNNNRDEEEDAKKKNEEGLKGRRYLLTDLRVIDWWDLASRYPHSSSSSSSSPTDPSGNTTAVSKRGGGEEEPSPVGFRWVQELMYEHRVKALPRSPRELGRALDSREFWHDFGLMPVKAPYEKGRL